MIRFFRSSFFIQYAAICVSGLVLWGRSFFEPPPMPAPGSYVPLYSLLYSWISALPVLQVILGYILVVAEAVILNRLLYNHNIVQKNSSLSGFIFIILISCYPEFLTLQPVTIALFFLLLVLDQLFKSYTRQEALDLIYSAGFLTAAGSLFYFPVILFFFFILISFVIFRSLKWRLPVSCLFGLLTPYLFLFVFYFWFDKLATGIKEYQVMLSFNADIKVLKAPGYIALSSFLVLGYFYTLVYGLRSRAEKTIEKKRKNLLVNWMVFFVVVSCPFSSNLLKYHIELAFITFSGLVAFYLLQIRKTFWQELILLVLILFIITNNLFLLIS